MKRQDALGRFREQAGQIIEARDGMFWELLFGDVQSLRAVCGTAWKGWQGREREAGSGAGAFTVLS